MRTSRGRPRLMPDDVALLDAYGALYGRAERSLYAAHEAGRDLDSCKREWQQRFGLAARQFNAIAFALKGKVRAIKERPPGEIAELKAGIDKLKKQLDPRRKAPDSIQPGARKYRRKQGKLEKQEHRLAELEAREQSGKAHLCFGSRQLFNKQFHLEENHYAGFEAWKQDWEAARSGEFFVLGSKGETAGNQSCQIEWLGGCWFRFHLRLPDALVHPIRDGVLMAGDQFYLPSPGLRTHVDFDVEIPYGADTLITALALNRAISFRFKRDKKGWWVGATTEAIRRPRISCAAIGAISVDINEHHLAVTEIDRFGNPIASWRIPCCTYGLSHEQAQAVIGDAVRQVIAIAADRRKPLVLETLDFQKRKAELEGESKKYCRMLSGFAYRQIQTGLRARALDAGIEVLEDIAKYSSVIGKHKFARRYGLTVHQAAALAMARRGMGYSERPNRQDHVTWVVLAKNRHRHVWSTWGWVLGRDRAAVAPRRRPAKGEAKNKAMPRKARSRSSPSLGQGSNPG